MSTPPAVLIVDDARELRRALADGLTDAGYMVVTAPDAEKALASLAVVAVDLALIDLQLPGMDGLELMRELRERSPGTVLVVMTAYETVTSAIEALRLEAYDYLLKPFTIDEIERVVRGGLERRRQREQREMLLRQLERSLAGLQSLRVSDTLAVSRPAVSESPRPPDRPGSLSFGPLDVDLQRHVACMEGSELDLTPTEFNVLVTLIDRAPAVLSPLELMRQATGYQADLAKAREFVKWHIYHLRQKIESDPHNPRHILNVRGVGYRLAAD